MSTYLFMCWLLLVLCVVASLWRERRRELSEMCFIFPAEEIMDERLGIVKDLLRSEDAYLEHLRNIFDVYMEPLRWVM